MSAWTGFAAWMARERSAGERLPYATVAEGRTVVLRDGGLMQVLHLQGLSFETADTEDLNRRHAAREAALRALGGSRFVIRHHILRRRVSVSQAASFEDPICAEIDRRWQARMAERRLFVNDLFVTLLRRPARGKAGLAHRLSDLMGGIRSGDRAAEIRDLDAARETLMAALGPYGARLLDDYPTPHGVCSEPLEFLSALYNGELRPMLRPVGDVGRHIPYVRTSFGLDAVERRRPDGRSDFSAILGLKDYPPQATPGMLDALLRLPYEMTVSESFAFVDRQIAQERVGLAVRRMRAADDDSASLRHGLTAAKDDIASGAAAFGEHQMSVLVRADSLEALDAAAADCAAALADVGAVAVREDLALEPAFWAQLPGNEAYGARTALVSSGAFAALASLHGFPISQAEGGHWGRAVSVLETTSATPYFFNFHQGDLGHFTVIGPSGSGKTVALNFLAAQARKLADRAVFFDKDRGAEIFLRATGGVYASLRPGEPTGFNPLQLPDTPADRAFLRTWIASLVTGRGEGLTPAQDALIAAAVDANYDQDPVYRRLCYFRELLEGRGRPGPDDLASRLAPWCGEGEHAWLFDAPQDRLDIGAATLGFDMTELLDSPALRTPAMLYLFHRVEERLDGSPTLIVIDEGWKALDDPVFAARIRDWMKTLRKRNAIVGFGTQSARDALDSAIASAVIEQAATQLFMPNPRARAEDYCAGFGLTRHELDLVRALPGESRCFLVKHGGHSVVARLDLSGMPDLVAVLSGREASVRRLDELRRRLGDHPAHWWGELVGTPWPGPTPARRGARLRSVS
ncbi:VirB4 family type IV secretion/conjugal transfer ATPase [Phenylobacterium aquaticum]|uniref:VirB4 family type IV secretion/conjugal transfer ATPase n=1 Tax=Phenylobacterium aquaticum TaxID=1763816 RepID=UPI001F5D1571|nr:VirB4 family type IV secretion/conjugal transfer ATPase [Phenylobacterium aquaticum]MCI3131093.1 VirB4 family type IV secretion/conjugal transfer ATPase [Phenylobacterium aquaticum]